MLSVMAFITACNDKKEKSVEEHLNDAANNVKNQLNKLDDAAKKHSAEFSNQVQSESKSAGAKAEDALDKMDKKATEIINGVNGKDKEGN